MTSRSATGINVEDQARAAAGRLGRLLGDERRRQGVTQRNLAERIGIAQSSIGSIENAGGGRLNYVPSLHSMVRLAVGLGVEIDFTLERR